MTRQLAVRAHVAVTSGSPDARERVKHAMTLAEKQGALSWVRYCHVLTALLAPDARVALSGLIRREPDYYLPALDPLAEDVCAHLAGMDDDTIARLTRHAERRSDRWLSALRVELTDPSSESRWRAAEILDAIGTADDIPALRALARSSRGSRERTSLGRALARRLAPRFVVEDLGRVEITSGRRTVPATSVRRKVLAMLCFLLTRPRFAATRDEVIDALWPDLSPDVAVNSLNQTVYFLRRVFEPTYVEDISAGYVHHNSDMLWLDPELVSSRSSRCLTILSRMGSSPRPEDVDSLSREYTDRFALDFAYEDWAVPFRTSLHVAYLEVVEATVTRDMASGHEDRAIALARRALEVDEGVESLELALVRLYRATGAYAAAAEQYAHYATVQRDEFGVDPPPLASL
jgi:DNA-binding SARP family transcriptional activator